jgi:predicted RNase H-like HicB family nuclease
MTNNTISYKLPVIITKQNKRFVAYTPALDLSTCGKTEKEVKSRFEEISRLFFEEIIEAGTADSVLEELGWKKVQKKWTPPEVVSSQSIGLKLPAFA